MKVSRTVLFALFALAMTAGLATAQLSHDATSGIDPGEAFAPPGTLYDNDVSDGITSLASQDSSGTFQARTADDFTIAGAGCASGLFDLSLVRVQVVQQNATPQAFGVEFYADDGTGNSPTPTNAISPIASLTQASQTPLGPFGATTSLFEASFDATGVQLAGDTVFWISAFGVDAAQNAGGFNNFFATSVGAAATPANSVIIAPGAGVPTWTPVDAVIGPPALHFSFAIDGVCAVVGGPTVIPTLNGVGIVLLLLLLSTSAVFAMRRRRAV